MNQQINRLDRAMKRRRAISRRQQLKRVAMITLLLAIVATAIVVLKVQGFN